MTGMEYAGVVLSTAAGGFDPAPVLIMAAALAAGVDRRHVLGASALLLAGTGLWGAALTVVLGPRVEGVDWWGLIRHGLVAAQVELGTALALGGYTLWRVHARRRSPGHPSTEEPRTTRPWALYATAVAFVGIVVLDVPFDVHVAAASTQPLVAWLGGWAVWALLSQLPLTLLVLLTLVGRQQRFSVAVRRAWALVSPRVDLVVTWFLGGTSLLMLLDAGSFLARGSFLVG